MSKNLKLVMFADGGSRGNPGPAATGVVIKTSKGKILTEYGEYIGETTNNQAEYQAVLSGIRRARELGAEELDVFLDSELIVKQMNGEYRVKNKELARIYLKVHNELIFLKKVRFTHVRREKNKQAYAQVNIALDRHLK